MTAPDERWKRRAATLGSVACLVVAGWLAYRNSFTVPLLFDDNLSIAANPSLRDLSAWRSVLFPPDELFTAGRPLLNLSFALNYAVGGTAVAGYHLVNLLIHLVAACTLFAVVRRTIMLRSGAAEPHATGCALAAAAIWCVHPLLTNSVTYLSQRAESLAAACCLLVLYALLRSVSGRHAAGWQALAVVLCFFALAAKEVVVATPLLVLAFDRTFLAGSVRAAWRQRRRFYLALGLSWVWLGALMLLSHVGAREIGAGANFTPWRYLAVELTAVVRYLRLAVWPTDLVFDYGPDVRAAAWQVAVGALTVGLLLGATILAWRRRSPLGFLGVAFFLLLAPTTSVMPVQAQPIAESRMYLPLAAVVLAAGVGLARWGRMAWVLAAAVAVVLGIGTYHRNETYRSELTLWSDTVAKRPDSSRAQDMMAVALSQRGDWAAAAEHGAAAVRIRPDYAVAQYNLGLALAHLDGREAEAAQALRAAVRLRPAYAEAHNNLALLLTRDPAQRSAAIVEYREALRSRADLEEAHNNLALLLSADPATANEAIREFEAALKLRPDFAEAHFNFANILARDPTQRTRCIAEYEATLQAKPTLVQAHNNVAKVYAQAGNVPAAIQHLRQAVRLSPTLLEAHFNLAVLLAADPTTRPEAIAHCRAVLELRPELPIARQLLKQLGAE